MKRTTTRSSMVRFTHPTDNGGGETMPGDETELYQERIQEYYEEPYHRGRCSHSPIRTRTTTRLCGDVIRLELQIDDRGTLKEVFFNGDGCCISQAAASMLVEKFDGQRVEDVKQFTAQDMLELFGVRLTPNRQKCCLLSWRVLQAAIYSPVQGMAPLTRGESSRQLPPTKEGAP